MITNSMIAFGDQLGAQLTTLASLMYIGIKNEQKVVFWEELKEYRRGFQFLDVFEIDDVELIGRSNKIGNSLIKKYCSKYGTLDNWTKQMRRIYHNKPMLVIDRIVYNLVKLHYLDFISISDLKNDIYSDNKLLELNKENNYDIKNGFGTLREWENYADRIIGRIHFKEWVIKKGNQILSCINDNKMRVSIHLRRTDYLVMSSLNLNDDYYMQAMSYFDVENTRFIVFSDDIEECKSMTIFNGKDVLFMNRNPAAVDMYLMSQMDGNIIANSTFSVWGALLNKKAEKVVCPHDFIGPEAREVLYINGNYYPETWIAI